MTLPANIRVNVAAPFPSIVAGQAPFSIAKANGIFTLGLSLAGLQVQQPPASNFAQDYILVWDSIAGIFFRMPLSQLTGGGGSQRSVVSGPVTISTTDQILNLNLGSPQTIILPLADTRNGVALTLIDVGNQATANPITIAATSPDTINNQLSIPLNTNGQAITLMPASDGVNAGWFEK